MQARIGITSVAPEAYKAMSALEAYVRRCGLEKRLIELIKLRASQMNGCAFCIDMHWKDARAAGEEEQRLYGLNAWRESPYFSDAERAALALAETITRIADRADPVPDDVWNEATRHYSAGAVSALVLSVSLINVWNRLNAATRQVAGAWTAQYV